jgi:hypothetical protein
MQGQPSQQQVQQSNFDTFCSNINQMDSHQGQANQNHIQQQLHPPTHSQMHTPSSQQLQLQQIHSDSSNMQSDQNFEYQQDLPVLSTQQVQTPTPQQLCQDHPDNFNNKRMQQQGVQSYDNYHQQQHAHHVLGQQPQIQAPPVPQQLQQNHSDSFNNDHMQQQGIQNYGESHHQQQSTMQAPEAHIQQRNPQSFNGIQLHQQNDQSCIKYHQQHQVQMQTPAPPLEPSGSDSSNNNHMHQQNSQNHNNYQQPQMQPPVLQPQLNTPNSFCNTQLNQQNDQNCGKHEQQAQPQQSHTQAPMPLTQQLHLQSNADNFNNQMQQLQHQHYQPLHINSFDAVQQQSQQGDQFALPSMSDGHVQPQQTQFTNVGHQMQHESQGSAEEHIQEFPSIRNHVRQESNALTNPHVQVDFQSQLLQETQGATQHRLQLPFLQTNPFPQTPGPFSQANRGGRHRRQYSQPTFPQTPTRVEHHRRQLSQPVLAFPQGRQHRRQHSQPIPSSQLQGFNTFQLHEPEDLFLQEIFSGQVPQRFQPQQARREDIAHDPLDFS